MGMQPFPILHLNGKFKQINPTLMTEERVEKGWWTVNKKSIYAENTIHHCQVRQPNNWQPLTERYIIWSSICDQIRLWLQNKQQVTNWYYVIWTDIMRVHYRRRESDVRHRGTYSVRSYNGIQGNRLLIAP